MVLNNSKMLLFARRFIWSLFLPIIVVPFVCIYLFELACVICYWVGNGLWDNTFHTAYDLLPRLPQ